jgi:hypothetical protein
MSDPTSSVDAERRRLDEDERREKNWKRFGPYLSERQWGTVREDYSESGDCWSYFPHDQARSRAYRWGEDGLLGLCDRECRICFAVALWNGKDPILKERLFGLGGPEGNHGEDVKELYYYLDATPTTSYAKALYKYPQAAFPYETLIQKNGSRGRDQPEFELEDTGVFEESRYFDVQVEYAKETPDDVLIRITVSNRGPDPAKLHVLPTLWYRNTWSWGCKHEGCWVKPALRQKGDDLLAGNHATLGQSCFRVAPGPDGRLPAFLFTDNETNTQKLFGVAPLQPYVKDAFHRHVIGGEKEAVNPKKVGTKVAAHYVLELAPGRSEVLRLRLSSAADAPALAFGAAFDRMFAQRIREADEFYAARLPGKATEEECAIARQAYAGLLWSRQFYHYVVRDWLDGDPEQPPPPESRAGGRNHDWPHLFNRDVVSMPDKWEYPWYAAWDLAFHMLPFAHVDPNFAKEQIVLFLREWYMHPNGQLPAYEFALGDVNPPVHAWAAWRVYKASAPAGQRDRAFLQRVFQKLLINFTWWVNRKDAEGDNIFGGGFLGLDNIGIFDRSKPLPTGGYLEQADGTAWMAFYCTTMLSMALELAQHYPAYDDLASKFFEHFVAIVDAMNDIGGDGLWDEQDGFYYDEIRGNGRAVPLRVRSMVGLIPLFAVEVLHDRDLEKVPGFKKRMDWFLANRRELARHVTFTETAHVEFKRRLLAIPSRDRLERVLKYMLDENEFLSPYGIRSLSKVHAQQPFVLDAGGERLRVDYSPGESTTALFGGNSNWRGPIWFPVNYLLIESLERYHHFYGDGFKVECPTGSGNLMNLKQVAHELCARLTKLFLRQPGGKRPCHGASARYAQDPHWRDLLLFHEYFHGDDGRGLGASHQTGWTALVVRCIEDLARQRASEAPKGVPVAKVFAPPDSIASLPVKKPVKRRRSATRGRARR